MEEWMEGLGADIWHYIFTLLRLFTNPPSYHNWSHYCKNELCCSYLCADLVYVILFPQLLLVIHWSHGVNKYGCLASYFIGMILRVLGE